MSEHLQQRADHSVASEELTPDTPQKPGLIKRGICTARKHKLATLIAVSIPLAAYGYKVHAWNSKINSLKTQEKQLLGGKLQCLNRAVILHAGVKYSSVPNSQDQGSTLVSLSGFKVKNTVRTVPSGQELQAKRVVILPGEGHESVIGLDDIESKSTDVSERTYWVNTAQYANKTIDINGKEHNLIEEFPLNNNPYGDGVRIDCGVKDNQIVTAGNEHLPAAMMINTVRAGSTQETIDFMNGNK